MLPDAQNLNGSAGLEPAANAVKYGLAATKHLPAEILLRTQEISERIAAEQSPKTEIERQLQIVCARQFATLEFAHECEVAALLVGGRNAHQIAAATNSPLTAGGLVEVSGDDFLAAAVGSDYLEKLIRYRRSHETALGRALNHLETFVAMRDKQETPPLTGDQCRRQFPDVESCVRYLTERNAIAEWQCPRCEARSVRHWLKTRQRWECGSCGAQLGLRQGTVMENSPIPYQKWFWSILLISSNKETSAAQIADELDLGRLATAKRIRDAIVAATESPRGLQLLMGLPELAIRMMQSPETSVSSGVVLRNEGKPVLSRAAS